MTRVLVAGAGAVGQWLGARLAAAGHEAHLLARPAHVEAIRAHGLRVEGLTEWRRPLPAAAEPGALRGPFEAVVLTSKAHATASVAAAAAPLLAADGFLCTLQNGLGNHFKAAAAAGPHRVAVAVTSHGLTALGPGHVRHAGLGPTLVGGWPGHAAGPARRAMGLLADAGLEPQWRDDMRGPVWAKAAVNAAINPVGALHGAANGNIAHDGRLRSEALALAGEAAEVAAKAGISLGLDAPAAALGVLERTAANRNSMLQDVEARRPTETEQISGRLLRAGQRLGLAMPATSAAYQAMKDLEASYLGRAAAAALAEDEKAWELREAGAAGGQPLA